MPKYSQVKPEDRVPLAQIRRGGKIAEQGFTVLYKRYSTRVYNHLNANYKFPDTQIEDITGEVMMKFYQTIKTYREDCNIYTWLCKIAHYTAIDYFRSKEGKQQKNTDLLSSLESTDGNSVLPEGIQSWEDIERGICLERCLTEALAQTEKKDEECYKALTLKAFGSSDPEIAKVLKRTVNATKVFIYNCRKKLQQKPILQACRTDCLSN